MIFHNAFRWCATLVSAKLGRCPRCWRLSLRGAVLGWIVSAIVYSLGPTILWPVVVLWPLSFTILWLLHVVTFGARVVRARNDRKSLVGERALGAGLPASTPSTAMTPVSDVGAFGVSTRRQAVRIFALGTVAAIFASLELPELAWADCSGDKPVACGPRCCPQGAYIDCFVDDCDPKKSRTCYPYTDENAYYVQKCCSIKYLCR